MHIDSSRESGRDPRPGFGVIVGGKPPAVGLASHAQCPLHTVRHAQQLFLRRSWCAGCGHPGPFLVTPCGCAGVRVSSETRPDVARQGDHAESGPLGARTTWPQLWPGSAADTDGTLWHPDGWARAPCRPAAARRSCDMTSNGGETCDLDPELDRVFSSPPGRISGDPQQTGAR